MDIDTLIAEVRRLDAEATKGPWQSFRNRHPETSGRSWGWIEGSGVTLGYYSENHNELAQRNAALIAYFRTACPLLAAEITRLRSQLAAEVERRELADGLLEMMGEALHVSHNGQPVCSWCGKHTDAHTAQCEYGQYMARYGKDGG